MIYTKEMFQEYIDEELAKYHEAQTQVIIPKKKDKFKKLLYSWIGGNKEWNAPSGKIDGRKIKRVLIFRYDAIGDYITTSSVIRWIKAAIPDVQIDIISSPRNKILAEADPLVNKSYPITYAPGFSFSMFKILKYRRIKYYDLLFAFVFWKTTKSAILSRLVAPDAEKVTFRHRHRTHIYGLVFNRMTEAAVPGYTWAQKMALCAIDNIKPINSMSEKDSNPYIFISDKNYDNLVPIIQKYNLQYKLDTENIFFYGDKKDFYKPISGRKYVVINIAGSQEDRVWANDNVIDYCKRLLSLLPDIQIFVTGGPQFKPQVEEIIEKVCSTNCVAINIGLLDFISFTAGAYFAVTPDTGVVHFAAAAKVPLIALYAERTKILEWHPHKTKNVLMLSPDKSSINYITNDEMVEATKMLISEIGND